MRAFLKRGLLAVLTAVASFGPAMAQAESPVHVALTAPSAPWARRRPNSSTG